MANMTISRTDPFTNVTSIEESAFDSCSSLTNVTIPNSVTLVGDQAFQNSGLVSITIPDSVTYLGPAFTLCKELTSVTIGTNINVIWDGEFQVCASLPSINIPDSVTNIGDGAFVNCTSLTNVTIPNSVIDIGDQAFEYCLKLNNINIPGSVTSIGSGAFYSCIGLTNVTIPGSVTSIGDEAYYDCPGLAGIYFQGNAPSADSAVFSTGNNTTVYYLPGTTGWGSMFGGVPTAFWFLPNPLILNNESDFGVQANGFGFTISWATNISVVVQACTNLSNPVWLPLQTNALAGGTSHFSDPQWTNYPGRFYRLRTP